MTEVQADLPSCLPDRHLNSDFHDNVYQKDQVPATKLTSLHSSTESTDTTESAYDDISQSTTLNESTEDVSKILHDSSPVIEQTQHQPQEQNEEHEKEKKQEQEHPSNESTNATIVAADDSNVVTTSIHVASPTSNISPSQSDNDHEQHHEPDADHSLKPITSAQSTNSINSTNNIIINPAYSSPAALLTGARPRESYKDKKKRFRLSILSTAGAEDELNLKLKSPTASSTQTSFPTEVKDVPKRGFRLGFASKDPSPPKGGEVPKKEFRLSYIAKETNNQQSNDDKDIPKRGIRIPGILSRESSITDSDMHTIASKSEASSCHSVKSDSGFQEPDTFGFSFPQRVLSNESSKDFTTVPLSPRRSCDSSSSEFEMIRQERLRTLRVMESLDSPLQLDSKDTIPPTPPTIIHHPTPPVPLRTHTGRSIPPRKSPAFSWFKKSQSFSHSSTSSRTIGFNDIDHAFNCDLILNRLKRSSEVFTAKEQPIQDIHRQGLEKVKGKFEQTKAKLRTSSIAPELNIDWNFWTYVIHDYATFARNTPAELSSALTSGIPNEIRGFVWQLILQSKSAELEDCYNDIITQRSPFEKQIKRDLAKTSIVIHTQANDKMISLFNVIKAYSLYDKEVGYTQGMAHIVVPLILNMTESEAFCALVALMYDYGLRQFYLPDMPGLHVRLYQFDRLLEDNLPQVSLHLSRNNITSLSFASDWFLSLFAHKFPISIVLRIFDIIISEGIESLLKFSICLMERNSTQIMLLSNDDLKNYLKEKLFDFYLSKIEDKNDNSGQTFMTFIKSATANNTINTNNIQYRINELINDASSIKLVSSVIKKYENEYNDMIKQEFERKEELENLRSSNIKLNTSVKQLESELSELNKEHIEIANIMVQGKVTIANIQDENDDLQVENYNLKQQLAALENEKKQLIESQEVKLKDQRKEIETEINQTIQRNAEVMETNRVLEEQTTSLEDDLFKTKEALQKMTEEHKILEKKFLELRKALSEE